MLPVFRAREDEIWGPAALQSHLNRLHVRVPVSSFSRALTWDQRGSRCWLVISRRRKCASIGNSGSRPTCRSRHPNQSMPRRRAQQLLLLMEIHATFPQGTQGVNPTMMISIRAWKYLYRPEAQKREEAVP